VIVFSLALKQNFSYLTMSEYQLTQATLSSLLIPEKLFGTKAQMKDQI